MLVSAPERPGNWERIVRSYVGIPTHSLGRNVSPLTPESWKSYPIRLYGKNDSVHGVRGGDPLASTKLLVIAGYSGDARTCSGLFDIAERLGMSFESVNLQSHGGAGTGPPTYEGECERIAQIVADNHRRGQKVVFAVASAGAPVAWLAANHLGEDLLALVDVAGHDHPGREPFDVMIAKMLANAPATFLGHRESRVNSPTTADDTARFFGHIAANPIAAARVGRMLWNADAKPFIRQFREKGLPLVLISAENDSTSPLWMFEETHESGKPRAFAVVPDAGHLFCNLKGPVAGKMIYDLLETLVLSVKTNTKVPWAVVQTRLDAAVGRPSVAFLATRAVERTSTVSAAEPAGLVFPTPARQHALTN